MKQWFLACAFVGVALSVVACGPKNPNLSPRGQVAVTADQVVTRLGELENTVINLGGSGQISTPDARTIVAWISGDKNSVPPKTGVVDAIVASPGGWRAVLKSGWPAVRPLVAKYGPLAAFLSYVDAVVQGV